MYTYHNFFVLLSISGHLGCFHFLAVVHSAAVNIGVHVYGFPRLLPNSGIAGLYGSFNIWYFYKNPDALAAHQTKESASLVVGTRNQYFHSGSSVLPKVTTTVLEILSEQVKGNINTLDRKATSGTAERMLK